MYYMYLEISPRVSLTSLTSSFTFAENSDEGSARSGEGDKEGDRKEPLRFESLEVTLLEQSVPDRLIKTYDEVTTGAKKTQITPYSWNTFTH